MSKTRIISSLIILFLVNLIILIVVVLYIPLHEPVIHLITPFLIFWLGLIAWYIGYQLVESKRLHHAELMNLFSIVQVERSLGDNRTSFRFHGITDEDFEEADVTAKELAYLVASFTAGRIYDAGIYSESDMKKPFDESHYRYKMLAQLATRRAWPTIAKMMTADAYIDKIEITMNAIVNEVRIAHNRKRQLKLCWPFKWVYIS
jgi:hypothetical protein